MLGVGILFKARQLRAHHGPCLEGDGEPLKETLTAIAPSVRGRAAALARRGAARGAGLRRLLCGRAAGIAGFCIYGRRGRPRDAQVRGRQRASKVASTVDQVLWEEESVDDIATLSRPALEARSTPHMLAQGPPPHKSGGKARRDEPVTCGS